jgi:DNA-directed RNA polymerase subunit omega
MEKFSYERCLKKIPSRFELVVVASKRAEQLLKGSKPRVESDHNPARTALREIGDGKLLKDGTERVYRVEMTEIPEAEKETAEAEEEEQEEEVLATA